MKDAGRISAAIEVLADIAETRRPVTDVLKEWGARHRFAGSGDRVAIGNLVFDVFRKRASLAAVMGRDSPRALVLAAYVRSWKRGLEGLDAALADDRHAPPPPDAAERAALVAPLPADLPDHVRADLPEWLAGSFRRAFGERMVEEGEALAGRADVDLRVNTLKGTREEALASLGDLDVRPGAWSPVAIRVRVPDTDGKPPHVPSELAYKRGLVEIQDEGSQLAALLAAASWPSEAVDLCAGGGGKTLALAAVMGNAGRITAYDADKRRFGDILDRLARAGVTNVDLRAPVKGGDALAHLHGKADLVLVDAPCSGSGTWRRRPDAKWRLAQGALAMRVKQQAEVLEQAARLVRPGGRIVYVTCSVLPEENEERIAAFVAAHPGFTVGSAGPVFEAMTGRAAPEAARLAIGSGDALRLTPATTGTDAFFIAFLDLVGTA